MAPCGSHQLGDLRRARSRTLFPMISKIGDNGTFVPGLLSTLLLPYSLLCVSNPSNIHSVMVSLGLLEEGCIQPPSGRAVLVLHEEGLALSPMGGAGGGCGLRHGGFLPPRIAGKSGRLHLFFFFPVQFFSHSAFYYF